MPSFSKMAVFPVGYYRAITSWLLRERRDVLARIATLTAEMDRIGLVKMRYRRVPEGDSINATEQRLGFSIPEGTALCRLVQAYIAEGGNPMNICGFLYPDTTEVVARRDGGVDVIQEYPGGGAPGAMSADYNWPLPEDPETGSSVPKKSGYEGSPAGMVRSSRYMPGRLGSRMDRGTWDSNTVTRVMHETRKWANKEIKTRLQDKEWRIIKLSDCCEQLKKEREETLMEAFGGLLVDMPDMDPEKFDPRRTAQVIIADFYNLLYDTKGGLPLGFKPSPTLGLLYFAVEDVPEDGFEGMG